MDKVRYLVIGGGMTGDAACRGIRDHDTEGSIAVVSAEPHAPYARPPLSKALWKGDDEAKIWRGTDALGVDLRLGRRIVSLDVAERRAADDQGTEYGYERVVIATGGTPRRFPFDTGESPIVYFRTLDDYRGLRALAGAGKHVIVVGGGFIGSEIAAALQMNGCRVTLVLAGDTIGGRLYPDDLARFVTDYYRERGVEVIAERAVAAVEPDADRVRVRLADERVLTGDGVVAGLGIEPNDALAAAAGLVVDDGVAVDRYGRALDGDGAFAAGDVARFPLTALGTETRVEHEDHAVRHGRAVGANMAGADEPYDHVPFFYSDLFDLGYEAVGEVDSRHDTVADWREPYREGVVYYLGADRRVRGVLLWNVWDKVDAARELIRAGEAVGDEVSGLIG